MDKREILINELYQLHQQLVDVFHTPSEDNLLLAKFCDLFGELFQALKVPPSPNRFALVFKADPDLYNKKQLIAHVISAAEYAANLVTRISADKDISIGNEFIAVIFDFHRLFKAIAAAYNLSASKFAGNRNMKVDSYTSFKIAGKFFWCPSQLQRSNTTNGYTIFALRQALELAGKELIGLKAIVDEHGQTDRYAAQIPWQFIVANIDTGFIRYPYQAADIQKIYKWTNHFVHTGNDAYCWVNALALQTVDKIYARKKITGWDGQPEFVYPNEITNYGMLKQTFETYLLTVKHKPRFAIWAPSATLGNVTG
jgi:hypothetical protein